MVSLWPFRAQSSSPASFEKTLSALSIKITDTQSKLDRLRASSRRVKALWTLYLTFAYLVYTIVLLLVAGYNNLGSYEWTAIAGGPVLIFAMRATFAAYFNFRIAKLAARLKEQQQEREKTIQKLKDATKYDSTMELIAKYGGARDGHSSEAKPGDGGPGKHQGSKSGHGQRETSQRTQMPPPATANIQRRHVAPQAPGAVEEKPPSPSRRLSASAESGAEFAPNAFALSSAPPPYYQYNGGPSASESHWYDRVFDVLLGEDEAAPKNRIVLICKACRLVNGQAPPGTKSLAELGAWKCMSCGATNGEMDEGKRIVNEVLATQDTSASDSNEAGAAVEIQGEDAGAQGVEFEESEGQAVPTKQRRARAKK